MNLGFGPSKKMHLQEPLTSVNGSLPRCSRSCLLPLSLPTGSTSFTRSPLLRCCFCGSGCWCRRGKGTPQSCPTILQRFRDDGARSRPELVFLRIAKCSWIRYVIYEQTNNVPRGIDDFGFSVLQKCSTHLEAKIEEQDDEHNQRDTLPR